MLKKLLSYRRSSAPLPAIPEGIRVYAIGDIHGRLDLYDQLLAMIAEDDQRRTEAQTQLILLGDLVDRGPDSAGVLQRTLELKRRTAVRILKGNHEEMMLSALDGETQALRMFCRIGGRETIFSYGLARQEYEGLEYSELAAEMLQRVPDEHLSLMKDMEDVIVLGDYVFVHAGIRPGVPLHDQKVSDLRWIREPFLSHKRPFERFVVHGHTIAREPEIRDNRIGIDTGAYATGALTALGLEGTRRWIIQTDVATAPPIGSSLQTGA